MPHRRLFGRSIASLDEILRLLRVFSETERPRQSHGSALELTAEELFTNMSRHKQTVPEAIEIGGSRSGGDLGSPAVQRVED